MAHEKNEIYLGKVERARMLAQQELARKEEILRAKEDQKAKALEAAAELR